MLYLSVQLSTAQLEPPEEQRRRFEIECEFVQALANPHYVNWQLPLDRASEVFKVFFSRKASISQSRTQKHRGQPARYTQRSFFLAQRGFLKEQHFVNYLKYLLYWKQPEYARALKYPQCLHFLECLQCPNFREALTSGANAKFIEDQQVLQWLYYLRKRQRLHVNPEAVEDADGKPQGDSEDDSDDDKAIS